MRLYSILTLILITTSGHLHAGFEIQEVIPGKVYSAKANAESGEDIYLGIELISGENIKNWESYVRIYGKSAGIAEIMLSGTHINPETRPKNDSQQTGWTDEEYNNIFNKAYSTLKDKDPEAMDELKQGFMGGIGAIDINSDGTYYIAYVSKKPITGYFPISITNPITAKSLMENNTDLLMIVRSKDIKETPVYNNRGIARTLSSIIEGGYKGLSLKLHAFTGEYFSKYHKKTHLSVAPLPVMLNLIESKVGAEKILKGSAIPEELNHFEGMYGMFDTKIVIKIEDLEAAVN